MIKQMASAAMVLAMATTCWAQSQSDSGSAQVGKDAADTVKATDQMNGSMPNGKEGVDVEFFKAAASGNNLEIKASQLALQRTTDTQVKTLAQMMIDDHTLANTLLQETCAKNNITLAIDTLDPADQAELDDLQQKQGPTFLHNYIWDMAGDHLKDVLIFSYHQNMVKEPITHGYAAAVLPKLQMHLAAIDKYAKMMVGAEFLTGGAGGSAESSYWTQNPGGGK